MTDQALRFRIGIFVLSALLLLAVLITLFGSVPHLFTPSHEYTIRFNDAPGIGQGTPVRRSGVRVGEVSKVELDDATGNVLVHVAIDRPYTLRNNEDPTLVQGLLGGDTTIDFVKHKDDADNAVVPPGKELEGKRQANLMADVVPSTQETLNDIRKSVQRFEKMAPLMEDTLKEYRELGKSSREGVPELRQAAKEVSELAKTTRETIPEIQKTNVEIRDLAKATRETMPEVKRAATEVGDMAKVARETLPELRKTNDEVRDLAKATRETVPEFRKAAIEAQSALVTWNKVGERIKLLTDKNEEKIDKAVDDLGTALVKLNDVLSRTTSVLSDENQRNLNLTLKNLRDGSARLDGIGKSTDELLKESRDTVRHVNVSLAKADSLLDNLNTASKPFADRGPAIMKNIEESTVKLNGVLGDMQELFKTFDTNDGSLAKLVKDPALYNHLDEAVLQIGKIVPRIDRVLKDVEVFSDKIARHPELLGVSGAIKPSAGIKDPPVPVWSKPTHP
jgi:phospholipid/cholesterol/gamma-HCH transport system substrate-binding protein